MKLARIKEGVVAVSCPASITQYPLQSPVGRKVCLLPLAQAPSLDKLCGLVQFASMGTASYPMTAPYPIALHPWERTQLLRL